MPQTPNISLPYQPLSTVDSYRTKQSSYTSSYSETQKYLENKPPSSHVPKDPIVVPSYQPIVVNKPGSMANAAGKNQYGLNVSL